MDLSVKNERSNFFDMPNWAKSLGHRLYNHNPFYLISAGLILYGLHLSFSGSRNLADWWMLMQLLCAYTLLLAVTARLVVRYGVWDDARTILLVILLLLVAMSISFDEVTLDSPELGARYLAAGLLFSLAVCEGLLVSLRMRLAAWYRLPFYFQLLLLFIYPVWLAHLSVSDQEPRMSWYVFLFPSIAGLTLLALIPAAHWGKKDERPSGTPWPWPLYPWSLFVFMAVGLGLRSYSLSMAFEIQFGMQSGFAGYFHVPLLAAAGVLVLELAITVKKRWLVAVPLLLPVFLLYLAFPGDNLNDVQRSFLVYLQDRIGTPPFWTTWLLVGYYTYLWLRGVKAAEAGWTVCLALATVVAPDTLTLDSLAEPQPWPVGFLVVSQLTLGLWRRSTLQIVAAGGIGAFALAAYWPEAWFAGRRAFYPIHLTLVTAFLCGLMNDDMLARRVRKALVILLPAGALSAALAYPSVFPDVPGVVHVGYALVLIILSLALWRQTKNVRELAVSLVCMSSGGVYVLEQFVLYLHDTTLQKGLYPIMGGAACFIAALVISLIKGGMLPWLRRLIHAANDAAHGEYK